MAFPGQKPPKKINIWKKQFVFKILFGLVASGYEVFIWECVKLRSLKFPSKWAARWIGEKTTPWQFCVFVTLLGWLPSLKLTFSHLKMDAWNTIVSFWDGLFAGALAVSFREGKRSLQKLER